MTEANRCKRFERGLRAEIFDRILAHRIREYATLVDTAADVEAGIADVRGSIAIRELRPRPSGLAGPSESRDAKRPKISGFPPPRPERSVQRPLASIGTVGFQPSM